MIPARGQPEGLTRNQFSFPLIILVILLPLIVVEAVTITSKPVVCSFRLNG